MYRREKKIFKPGWIIVLLLLIAGGWFMVASIFGKISLDAEVTVKAGDTFGVFYSGMSDMQINRIKRYIRQNGIDTSGLEV